MNDQVDIKSIIANLSYDQYDPSNMTANQKDLTAELDRVEQSGQLTKDMWVTIAGFDCFSMLVSKGWERICYESHIIDGGYMYWVSDPHAKAIGQALKPTLKELRIDLTTLEGEGFSLITKEVAPEVKISELYINHRSGDEVTLAEASGLAQFIHKLEVETFHLWAPEYEDGALDTFLNELKSLGNTSLKTVDICDTSKSEPEDVIHHEGLNTWLADKK